MSPSENGNGVRTSLTRKKPKREKDNLEYLAMMRRMIRAYARRVVAEDPSTLKEMLSLRAELDEAIGAAALRLHDEKDFSWGVIGQEVGITRQSAFERWGLRPRLEGRPPLSGYRPLNPDDQEGR